MHGVCVCGNGVDCSILDAIEQRLIVPPDACMVYYLEKGWKKLRCLRLQTRG